jgi:hypothetical protein
MAISVNFDGRLIRQLGSYVKTDLSAVRQINGTSTGIVALLGLAEGGEVNTPYKILSYAEAVEIFKGGPLVDHIKAAFLGGAGEVVAVRIGSPTPAFVDIPVKNLDEDGEEYTTNWNFTSIERSSRSNSIYISFELDSGTSTQSSDDYLLISISQRHPDCSITKETYIFPRKFTEPVVLVRRGERLFFVDKTIINAALATGSNWKQALVNLLRSNLNNDDYVQIFYSEDNSGSSVPTDVPLGLVLYEILYGGLWGFNRSRLVKTKFGSVEDLLSNTVLFSPLASLRQFNQILTSSTDPLVVFSALVANKVAVDKFSVDLLLDNTLNAHIISNGIFSLNGGTNGDDGTGFYGPADPLYRQKWMDGVSALESEEVNFVVPAYRFTKNINLTSRLTFFENVASIIYAHVNVQSQTHIRKRRIAIFGLPAPSEVESYTSSEYLNDKNIIRTAVRMFGGSDRVQVWVGPFYSPAFSSSGRRELLGAEFLASFVAGMHANREPQVSLTFSPIAGIGYEPLYDWKYSQKDDLISNRIAFVEKVKNAFDAIVYRIHHNPTSWTGAVTVGYQEMVLRRIDDFLTMYLYKNLENQFIGRPSYGARTEKDIQAFTESLLARLVDKQISAFRDVKVTSNEDKTTYYVEFFFQPVNEIKFILVTMQVSFDLS